MPLHSLDIDGLELRLKYILKFLEPEKIIIITNKENFSPQLSAKFQNKIIFKDENKLIPKLNFNAVKNAIFTRAQGYKDCEKCISRAGWYFQQFLKMGYAKVATNGIGGGAIYYMG